MEGALSAGPAPPGRRRLAAAGLLGCLVACGGGSSDMVSVDVAPIVAELGKDELDGRDEAVARLVALGPGVLPALERALETASPPVRLGIVEVLEELGGPDVVEPLIVLASRDPDDEVRADALTALGMLGDPRAEAAVELALAEERSAVRIGGIGACASLCADPKSLTQLVDLALHAPLPDGLVARNVVGRLLTMGRDERRRRMLRVVVETRALDALAPATPAAGRVRAALLLADLADPTGLPVLLAALPGSERDTQRAHLVYALGTVGDARAVPALAALGDEPVGVFAHDALRRIAARGVPEADAALRAWSGPVSPDPMPAPYAVF